MIDKLKDNLASVAALIAAVLLQLVVGLLSMAKSLQD